MLINPTNRYWAAKKIVLYSPAGSQVYLWAVQINYMGTAAFIQIATNTGNTQILLLQNNGDIIVLNAANGAFMRAMT